MAGRMPAASAPAARADLDHIGYARFDDLRHLACEAARKER